MASFCNIKLSFRPEQSNEEGYTFGGIVWSDPMKGNFNTFAAKHFKKPIPQCQACFKDS